VVAWVRATRTGTVVDRALAEGLGAGWRDEIDPQTRAGLQPGFAVGAVSFLPLRVRRRDVVRVKNISYGDAGRHNRLDAYHHRSRPSGCPTLVHFHGGGLQTGTKNREALALIYRLASRGWVCISANYRIGGAAKFPDHLVDVKRVIAWVRAQGPMYGGDGSTVVVAGGSAGAQLASLAALTANDPGYQPDFEGADTSVTAAVALYGLYGWTSIRDHGDEVEREDLPAAHLQADAPPFFVSHGDLDTLLRVEGARDFVRALRAVSRNPVVYAELPGAHHSFDRFRSVRCDNVVNGIESFAAWVRATEARSHAP
jgi:acetyl esterase/lipase